VDAIGLNCSSGPWALFQTFKMLAAFTDKPLSALPNAGLPAGVDGRNIYLCSPEYLAHYAARFLEAGARIVGGCCGTTPAHIAAIAETAAGQPPRRIPSARNQTLLAGLEPMVIAA